jgi:hypothetical protein
MRTGPDDALQRTAAAILLSRSSVLLTKAAAGEPGRYHSPERA